MIRTKEEICHVSINGLNAKGKYVNKSMNFMYEEDADKLVQAAKRMGYTARKLKGFNIYGTGTIKVMTSSACDEYEIAYTAGASHWSFDKTDCDNYLKEYHSKINYKKI